MRALCWNCRGIGDPASVRELRNLVEASAPSVLCIVETQLAKYRVEGLASRLGFSSSFGVGSSGRSGGLCLYWKNNINLEIKSFSRYHIDSVISHLGSNLGDYLVFVEPQTGA